MSNSVMLILLSLILWPLVNNYANAAELGDGHNMPTSNLGDRMADLKFQTVPTDLSSNHNSEFDFSLVDNKTGNNIVHVTYLLEIMKDDKRLFTESVHSHDGNVKILFVPGKFQPYTVNANFDVLSASYVSDFGGLIKVNGMIFTVPGNYKMILEVTGIDHDNVFLPSPVKFEYDLKFN